jgi:trans-aconitate methyltransferase
MQSPLHPPHDPARWDAYNAAQGDRAVRPLCTEVLRLTGPGAGRTAVDLGCGLGRETDALLRAGWWAHAIDMAPDTEARVRAHTRSQDHGRLSVETASFTELCLVPRADLIYAGYSLPYLAPAEFTRFWGLLRLALRPGGWLAVDLLGDHDSWAAPDDPAGHGARSTFLSAAAARQLFDGLELLRFTETEEDGPAFSGPKHWHRFEVIARRPV